MATVRECLECTASRVREGFADCGSKVLVPVGAGEEILDHER